MKNCDNLRIISTTVVNHSNYICIIDGGVSLKCIYGTDAPISIMRKCFINKAAERKEKLQKIMKHEKEV